MLRRVWNAWDRFGWLLLSLGLGLVLVSGFVGFTSYADRLGEEWSLSTRLYLTLQLFTLESGGVDGAVPWTLELARWTAPVVVASAAVSTIAALARRRAWGWGARRLRGHVVVVGLGERGLRVVEVARSEGRAVAAIEIDPAGAHVSTARRLGVPVVIGDAADPQRLIAAGVTKASRLVVLVGDPAVGVAITRTVTAVQETGTRDDFVGFVAVNDGATVRELNTLLHSGDRALRFEFFTLEERAGPVIVDRWAGLRDVTDAPPPLVVVGTSAAAESVVSAAARQWQAQRRDVVGGGGRLLVHWVIEDAAEVERVRRRVDRAHPDVTADDSATSIRFHAVTGGDLDRELDRLLGGAAQPPGLVVVAEGPDAQVIRVAAVAERLLPRDGSTVVAITATGRSLVGLLAGHTRVAVFDLVDELCTDTAIARGQLEAMGRALHDGYLRQLDATLEPELRAAKPAYRSWEELAPDFRSQNYAAARAMWTQLRSHGYDVVPRTRGRVPVTIFPDDVVHDLAREEHLRWFAARHPGRPLPRWEDVDPTQVEQTRDQIRRIPVTLAAAGLQVTTD